MPYPREVVQRFLSDAWDDETDRFKLDVIEECFDLDRYWSHTWGGNLVETGRRQGRFFSAFTRDGESISDDLVADGDLVVHRVRYRTTVTGTVLGVTVENRSVEINHIEMWRVENGKIVEHWGGIGEADHLYRQLVDDQPLPSPG